MASIVATYIYCGLPATNVATIADSGYILCSPLHMRTVLFTIEQNDLGMGEMFLEFNCGRFGIWYEAVKMESPYMPFLEKVRLRYHISPMYFKTCMAEKGLPAELTVERGESINTILHLVKNHLPGVLGHVNNGLYY